MGSRTNFLKYTLEASIVSFGVILGLLLSEWNSNRKTNQNTENTLIQIIAELEQNSTSFKNAISYHEQIGIEYDSVASLLIPADMELIYYSNTKFKQHELPSWKGSGTVIPEQIIYESAQLSGVFQELNIATIRQIANIYQKLDNYSEFSKAPLNKFLAIDSNSKLVDMCIILELIKTDILNTEKSIVKELETTIANLKQIQSANSFQK